MNEDHCLWNLTLRRSLGSRTAFQVSSSQEAAAFLTVVWWIQVMTPVTLTAVAHLPPHNIPLGHPRAPAPSMLYPASDIDWRFDSYMIVYMSALWASLVAQGSRTHPPTRGMWVRSLGWEDLLEKEMAMHSSVLAQEIPWIEEPDGLRSMGSQKSQT